MDKTKHEIYECTLSKDIPNYQPNQVVYGYLEHWNSFLYRAPYLRGTRWSVASLAPVVAKISTRRANVGITEVLLPRYVNVRSLNRPITSVPYMWCFVRHDWKETYSDAFPSKSRRVEKCWRAGISCIPNRLQQAELEQQSIPTTILGR